jgi:D-glycero-alpha-D-manno-heptose-7-phosphate kinase
MIISQTPFRISFFGGGTDYPTWYREHGGAVFSTTINKYVYITCRQLPPFFEHKHRIVYSKIEMVSDVAQIDHPSVRACFKEMGVEEGLEIHYDGDLPARSGIGSSSSFTVGLLNTLSALKGQMRSKLELAEQALYIEQQVIKEAVGSQDQIAAAYGGLNRIEFSTNGSFSVKPVIVAPERVEDFNDRLMLFFTGQSRIAATVATSKINNLASKADHLRKMQAMVDEAQKIMQSQNGSLDDLGRMLHDTWRLKRELSEKVSNSAIDEIYQAGIDAGALGGKILGAGGGGFVLFYVPLELQPRVREALNGLLEVDFRFESRGSQIVHYNPVSAIYRGSRERKWATATPTEPRQPPLTLN